MLRAHCLLVSVLSFSAVAVWGCAGAKVQTTPVVNKDGGAVDSHHVSGEIL